MSTSIDERRKISALVSIKQEHPLDFLRIIYGMFYMYLVQRELK